MANSKIKPETLRDLIFNILETKKDKSTKSELEAMATELEKMIRQKKLVIMVAEDQLFDIVKKQYEGSAIVKIINYPERNQLVICEASIANALSLKEEIRVANRLAFVKKNFQNEDGVNTPDMADISKDLIDKLTKKA